MRKVQEITAFIVILVFTGSYQKKNTFILFLFVCLCFTHNSFGQTTPDFTWGNSSYFNIDIGDSISYNETRIELLKLQNHFNLFKIGNDTVWMKVSRRAPAVTTGGLRIFVADNKNVKALAKNSKIHGLLTKDAMICISGPGQTLLDLNKYIFPVSFNDGFLWSGEEDSYLFSYINMAEKNIRGYDSYPGITFDLDEARGIEKHWLLAIENSKVVWIEDNNPDFGEMETSVLLESESQPGIYYFYMHLYKRTLEVRKGQKLYRSEPIGTVWGDKYWENFHFAVIQSDSVPSYEDCSNNIVNCFPQIFELYYNQPFGKAKHYSKGIVSFGKNSSVNRNEKNASAFETYIGKGWSLGKWNVADKVDYISGKKDGNVRLKKVLFENYAAECRNPENWYEYEIAVPIGIYRIRAKVGDISLQTWQKIEFESIDAGIFENRQGEFKWTSEKVVKVKDGKLTVRIYIDANNKKPAGISEIVFQKAG